MMNNYYPFRLIDSGIMVAFYNSQDSYHYQVVQFFSTLNSQLITTVGCITLDGNYHLTPPKPE